MRLVPVLFTITCLLLFTCGCSESPPVQPAVTATTATIIPSPAVTPIQIPIITPPVTASVSDNTVTIVKNTFSPANITVKAGSTVRWVNADDHPHRIEFADKAFTSSTFLLGAGQSASQRFDQAGTYDYSCMIHPFMHGAVTAEV
jgi:plastocyanin